MLVIVFAVISMNMVFESNKYWCFLLLLQSGRWCLIMQLNFMDRISAPAHVKEADAGCKASFTSYEWTNLLIMRIGLVKKKLCWIFLLCYFLVSLDLLEKLRGLSTCKPVSDADRKVKCWCSTLLKMQILYNYSLYLDALPLEKCSTEQETSCFTPCWGVMVEGSIYAFVWFGLCLSFISCYL